MEPILKPLGPEIGIGVMKNFNPNTGITANFITILTNPTVSIQIGQPLVYITLTGNTAVPGLVNSLVYFGVATNTTGTALSLTPGGANVVITPSAVSETGHFLMAANSVSNMSYIKVSTATANILHFTTLTGPEYANLTVTPSEDVLIQKAATDLLWGNGMLATPVVIR